MGKKENFNWETWQKKMDSERGEKQREKWKRKSENKKMKRRKR